MQLNIQQIKEVLIMKIEERLLRLPEVLERVPFGKTTLYRLF